jgi:two-component system cell cycle sensor histidine kinase/response regulator CckA
MMRMRDLLGLAEPARAEDPAFCALFEGLPDAAALLDAQGRVQQANAALRQALGPALPVRPGLPPMRLFASRSRMAAQAWLAGGAPPAELRLAAPEGMPEAPVAPRRIPLPDGASLLVLRDLTESHALAACVAEGDRLQALGTLAGGIAHDFNNLLAVVLGCTGDALAQLDPQQRSVVAELEQVHEAAQRGAALVRQLLAYARQQVLAPQLVCLNDAVRGMARLLHPLLGRQVTLELALEEPARSVRIDPSQLDRVLMNLAMNARQAMPSGGRLTLSTGRCLLLRPLPLGAEEVPAGRWTVLEVSDTGGGIAPEALPRIFDPFFTDRAQQGGTGMGLATVQGIVRQSGGYVTVESQLGQGTRFRILLPRIEETAPATTPSAATPPAATPPAACPSTACPSAAGPATPAPAAPAPETPAAQTPAPETAAPVAPAPAAPAAATPDSAAAPQGILLLVEDEPPLRRLAERALRRAGWDVKAAEDAESALALVEDGLRPAVMVSDVMMPGMDGVTLSRQLRKLLPYLPVLLVSGYAPGMVDAGVPDQESPGAALHFLAKPYATAELLRSVTEILAR